MTNWRVIALLLGALAGGCASEPVGNAASGNAATQGNAAASTAPPPPSEDGFRARAGCSATLEAMANLFDAVGRTSRDPAEQSEMRSLAAARRESARMLELAALDVGAPLGRTLADVQRVKSEREAELRRQQSAQSFEDFAMLLGRESDACAAFAPRPN